MKLQTEDFKSALKIVKPAVAKTELIEQTNSFVFDNGFVIGYNDEICISHPLDGLDVTGAVSADTLYNYVIKLKRPEMELKTSNKELLIKCGKSNAGLALQPEIVIPVDQITPAKDWSPLPNEFNNYLKMASGAAARDMSLPKLTCVNIGERTITGSDNFRILQCEYPEPFPFKGFLIPATSAKIASSLDVQSISVTREWVHMTNDDGTVISCRTYAEEYGDVSEFMKIEGPQFTFPKTMNEVLNRAVVFARGDLAQDEEVRIRVGDNRIRVTSKNNTGWFREEINHQTENEPFTFTIIPYLLQDILKRTQTCTVSENGLLFKGDGWQYVSALINME